VIPSDLHLVWQDGAMIWTRTQAGTGPAAVHSLGEITLLSGRLLLGFPCSPWPGNQPSSVRPEVPPGRYPVVAALVEGSPGVFHLAFVTVHFEKDDPASWEDVGGFCTDDRVGCLMDEDFVPLLEGLQGSDPEGFWSRLEQVKGGVLAGKPCSLVLDAKTGANAVVFDTFDSPCYLGRDRHGKPVCLVVDCR
jgi:hypothetical protein